MKTDLLKSSLAAILLAAAMATPAKGHLPEECKVEVLKVDEVRERVRQHILESGLMSQRHVGLLDQKTPEVMITVIDEAYTSMHDMAVLFQESTQKVDEFAKCVARNGG